MVFDPIYPVIYEAKFDGSDCSLSKFGHVQGEELPGNIPEPCVTGFKNRETVDSDHAADTVSHQSRTGFMVYFDHTPIYCNSKNQNIIKSSSLVSEFMEIL